MVIFYIFKFIDVDNLSGNLLLSVQPRLAQRISNQTRNNQVQFFENIRMSLGNCPFFLGFALFLSFADRKITFLCFVASVFVNFLFLFYEMDFILLVISLHN
jgi:hypothetical protein